MKRIVYTMTEPLWDKVDNATPHALQFELDDILSTANVFFFRGYIVDEIVVILNKFLLRL